VSASLLWAEGIPERWSLRRAKFLFRRQQRPLRSDDGVVTAFRDGQVTLRTKRREDGFTFADKEIGYHGVRVGDLVIHAMDGFAGAIGVSDSDGKCSPVCAVCTPLSGAVEVRYYASVLRHLAVSGFISSLAKGIRERSTDFRFAEFKELALPLPPKEDQKAIVSFLDHKTAAIDGLITKKERLIELLQEKRQALITQAVTKGLDLNVPMRDSGVVWIGGVPQHWRVLPLRRVVAHQLAGPYGSSLTKAMYSSSGVRVYGQQQVIPNDFATGDYYISPEKFAEMREYEVHPGDLLVTVMGTIGRVAVVPQGIERGIMNPRLVRYVIGERQASAHYVAWVLRSNVGISQLAEAAQGSTMDGLNLRIIGDVVLALPPRAEQDEIVARIEAVDAWSKRLSGSVQEQLERLREYRQALITAAVTGKFDVSKEAA
jgi:type I restriction enzyme S subunit